MSCPSALQKWNVSWIKPVSSSHYTLFLKNTFDPTYCKSGPSDRDATFKGVAIKHNSYDRRLNRLRKKNCAMDLSTKVL